MKQRLGAYADVDDTRVLSRGRRARRRPRRASMVAVLSLVGSILVPSLVSVAAAAPVTGDLCAPPPELPPDLVLAGYHVTAFNPPGEPALVSGEFASPTGGTVSSHTQITPANGYNYTGSHIQYLFQGQEPQHFLLTTSGLWVWGDDPARGNGAIRQMVTGKAFQEVALPVPPSDIANMTASEGVLAFRTTSGNVWVAGQEGRNNNSSSMYGDGSTLTDTSWHQVETAPGVPLTGIVDLEVTGDAAFAISSTGDWYTWGEQSRVGDGTGSSDRTRATAMTKPGDFTSSADLVQIGMVYDNFATDSAYMALHSNGRVYVMGGNSQGQLGLGNTSDTDSWLNMLNPAGTAPIEYVTFISGQNSEDKYARSGVLTSDPSIPGNHEMWLMGSNNGSALTRVLGDPQTLPGSPFYRIQTYSDIDGGGVTETDIEPVRMDIGGHLTMYYDAAQQHYAYTGHNSTGAFGESQFPENEFLVSQSSLQVISDSNCEIDLTSAITSGPVHNGDGTYDVEYTITANNVGNRDLTNVAIVEDLTASFGAEFVSSTLDSDSCAAATLFANDSCSQVITVTIAPGASFGPWTSTASVTADTPAGSVTDDTAPDLVTMIPEIPELAVALAVSSPPVSNGDGTYTVEYTVDASNTGNVAIDSVNVDNGLATTFGPALVSQTIITDDCSGSTLNQSIPAGAGDSCSQIVSVVVQPGANLGPWEANAIVSGSTASGGSATDTSNDIQADPEGDGAADNSTPTPVTFVEDALIGLANEVTTAPVDNGDGTYTIEYTMIATNFGDVPLDSIVVNDNMGTTFGAGLVSTTPTDGCAGVTLAPGESCTYVVSVDAAPGTYTGPIDNSAQVTAQTPSTNTVDDISQNGPLADVLGDGSPTDDVEPTPVDLLAPAVSIVHVAGNAPDGETEYIGAAGDVTHTYDLTNTGDTNLINLTVVDDNGTPGDLTDDIPVCTVAGPIAPLATAQCTTNVTTNADVTHASTVTATPALPDGSAIGVADVTSGDDASVDLVAPGVSIVDSTTTPTVNPGDSVTYTYDLTNTGDTALTNIVVVDDNGTPGNTGDDVTVCTLPGPLAAGGTDSCTSAFTINADVTQIATVTANPAAADGTDLPDIADVTSSDPESVNVINAALTIDTSTTTPIIYTGDTATFVYTITNSGDDPVAGVAVADTQCSPVSAPVEVTGNGDALIDPGESWTANCSGTYTADFSSAATATGADSLGQAVTSNTDSEPVDVIDPDINLVVITDNAADGEIEYIDGATDVTYTYVVENTGDDPLTSVVVLDDAGDPVPGCSFALLAVGERQTCTVTVNESATTTHTGSVSGLDSLSGSVDDTDPADVSLVAPAVSIATVADTPIVNPGETSTFTYTVTNTGDTDLSTLVVLDDNGTPGDPTDDGAPICTIAGPLAPGASDTCTSAPFVITADTTHTGSVSANPTAGSADMPFVADVADSDPADVNVINAALEITSITNDPIIYRGDTAEFVYSVENTGDDPVTTVTVADAICTTPAFDSEVSGNGDTVLDPGEVWNYTCTGTFTGDVTSSAVASGLDSLAQDVTSNTATVPVNVIDPDVSIATTADPTLTTPGSPITYTHIITNPGDDPLTSVAVTDDQGAAVTFVGEISGNGDTVLDPGEVWEYTSTLAAAPAADVPVIGSVTANDSLDNPVADTDTALTIVSEPPVADDEDETTNEATPVLIDVLDGDTDVDGTIDPTSVSEVTPPANGSIAIDPASGEIAYTPLAGFVGIDTFEYAVCDDDGLCDTALVTVTVNGAPVTDPELEFTNEATPVNIDVLDGDTDPEGDPLSVVTFPTPPANGTVLIEADGTITYTPEPGFAGTEMFTYEVCDDTGSCATDTVTVIVNDTPIGVDDSAGTLVDVPVTVDVLANDIDPDNNIDPTSVSIVEQPNNGTLAIDPITGEITFTPEAGFVGSDTFVYEFCDDAGACDTAVVTIDVVDTNTAPTTNDDADATPPATPVNIDVLDNDTDPESNIDPTTVTEVTPPLNGSILVEADGTITYTPVAGFSGQDTFEYQVCDVEGLCDTALVTVDVNDPPVATDDASATDVGTPIVIDVLTNDTPGTAPLDPTTVGEITPPANGVITIHPVNGDVTYTPNPGFTGQDTFEYEICDESGLCDIALVTVDINGSVDAQPDAETTPIDTPVTIDVQANDSDPEGGALTTNAIVTAPANGSAVIEADGTITYTPAAGFVGMDTFTYEVCDPLGSCAVTTVTVTVDGPPTANDDANATTINTPVNIDVLSNDTDPENDVDSASVAEVSPPANGSITIEGDGSIMYTPVAGFTGTDTFEYEVCDGAGQCATATVTVVVDDPLSNEPPVAGDDTDSTDVDVPISLDVLGNDLDPEGDVLNVDPATGITTPPASGGTAVVEADGSITYTPGPGFTGIDTFEYQVCDPSGACDTAIAQIDVNGPPNADDESVLTSPATPIDIDILNGDVDNDGFIDPTSVAITANPTNGTVGIDPATGVATYTPDAGFGGTDTFTYQVCDNDGLCDTAEVTVMVPYPPVAENDTASTDENTPVDIDVALNDTDTDGTIDPTTVSIQDVPSSGTVSVDDTSGLVTYTPNPGFSGVDSFTYEVCDDDGFCDLAEVDVSVNGVPIVKDDADATTENEPVTIPVLDNDTDVDGIDPTTVTIDSAPANGTVTIDPVTGEITYTPDDGFFGLDAFMYEVCDNAGLCNTASVTIQVNGLPDTTDDSEWTPQATAVTIDILGNDTDPDSTIEPTSVTVVAPPANGVVDIDPATGEAVYTPSPEFYGTDTFTYEVCDDLGACSTAEVTVVVDGAPQPVDDVVFTTQSEAVVIDLLVNDSDPDTQLDLTSVTIVGAPANGTVVVDPATGVATYTPNGQIIVPDTFVYEVCDTDGVCSTATVMVNPELYTLSGRVFLDLNRDGVVGDGESDISGVTVDRFTAGPDGIHKTADDVLLDSATTGSPYVFTNVLAGEYRLTIDDSTLPAGLFATDDLDGNSDRSIIVVVTGDTVGQDLGEITNAVSGVLTNENGIAIAGATVTLVDADGNTFSATTAADGSYEFVGVMGTDPIANGPSTVTAVLANGQTTTANIVIGQGTEVEQDLVVSTPPPTLAFTGAYIRLITLLAALLIGLGMFLVGIGRRRRSGDLA